MGVFIKYTIFIVYIVRSGQNVGRKNRFTVGANLCVCPYGMKKCDISYSTNILCLTAQKSE
jgi:hypothetical protein